MTSTYFEFENQLYEQIEGAPMGSPLSPVIADIYMEFFEEMAIQEAEFKPSVWLRYVDDTFVVWPHGKDQLDEFLHHLNNQRSSIQFTMEFENEGSIPFLDVLVERREEGMLTLVYRKPTYTNRYFNFKSNHHPRIKAGIVKCLTHGAKEVCHPSTLQPELDHIHEVLKTTTPNNWFEDASNNKAIRRNRCSTYLVAFLVSYTPNNASNNKAIRRNRYSTYLVAFLVSYTPHFLGTKTRPVPLFSCL
jgi:hypothetical protein